MATKFITISIEIMHDKNLTQTEKFILAEIEQLSSLEDGCHAQNKHFAELTGIAKVTVSRAIHSLESKGYITSETKPGSRNHVRLLTLNKMISPPIQNDKTPLTKRQETKENKQINKQSNIQEYVTLWNDLCESSTLSPVRTLSKARIQKILTREKEDLEFNDNYHNIITAIEESDFLNGSNEQGWKVSFDWIFHNDVNYLKILEGNYTNTMKKVDKPVNTTYDAIDKFFDGKEAIYAELA